MPSLNLHSKITSVNIGEFIVKIISDSVQLDIEHGYILKEGAREFEGDVQDTSNNFILAKLIGDVILSIDADENGLYMRCETHELIVKMSNNGNETYVLSYDDVTYIQ